MPSFNVSLVISVKLKAKWKFWRGSVSCSLQKIYINQNYIFFEDLLPHTRLHHRQHGMIIKYTAYKY